jgi:hypothetical protein
LFSGGPKGIPDEIIDKLNKEINVLANSKLKVHRRLGGTPIAGSAADYGKFLAVDGMGHNRIHVARQEMASIQLSRRRGQAALRKL